MVTIKLGDKMKNRLIIICTTVAITVILCAALFSVSAAPVVPEGTGNNTSSDTALHFTLAAWGNNIALYDDGEIIEVYEDILLSALPPADRTALNEGIEITSFEQLSSLLEDFES